MKALFKFLGVQSPAYTIWERLVSGSSYVGTDSLGNKYYRAKPRKGYRYERRWVRYKGAPEASNVPPEWHGWLHHQTEDCPSQTNESFRRPWQKPHLPNMTGTSEAYRPPGHALKGQKREQATGDYEAWTPGGK